MSIIADSACRLFLLIFSSIRPVFIHLRNKLNWTVRQISVRAQRLLDHPGGGGDGVGGGLLYITDGDARRNFQKKPLKDTILGVAPANFVP